MSKPKLVLSNTTTFFTGSIEAVFKKAKKHGFKYLELLPYRWTKPEDVIRLEKKYDIKVVGIHLPQWWNKSFKQVLGDISLFEIPFYFIWELYQGATINNPSLKLAELLKAAGNEPYLLLHSNLITELGEEKFLSLTRQFDVAVENIPIFKQEEELQWNPIVIKEKFPEIKIVFDGGHLNTIPALDDVETYKATLPEILHISYSFFPPHQLPNKKELLEIKQMLAVHSPEYIVIETNPLVSVKRAKKMFDQLLSQLN